MMHWRSRRSVDISTYRSYYRLNPAKGTHLAARKVGKGSGGVRPSRKALIEAIHQAGREHSTATVHFHAVMAERFGLNPTDTKTIELLERLGPMSAGDLVEQTGLASPSITAVIDRLEAKGIVRRVRGADDKRRVIVEVVPLGLEEISGAYLEFADGLGPLWAPYTVAELQTILDFQQRAAAHLRSELGRMAAARSSRGKSKHKP